MQTLGRHGKTTAYNFFNLATLIRRFIDNIIWISASERSNERIRKALTSAFANRGLELTFRQACTAEQTGEAEFIDVSHCITVKKETQRCFKAL